MKRKRFFAVLMAVLILVSYMPTAMYAASEEANDAKSVDIASFELKAKAKGKQHVKLSWSKVDGATRYVVYGAKANKVKWIDSADAASMSDDAVLAAEQKQFKKIASVKAKKTKFVVSQLSKSKKTKLKKNTKYAFYIAAYNKKALIGTTDFIKFKTGTKKTVNLLTAFFDMEPLGAEEETTYTVSYTLAGTKPEDVYDVPETQTYFAGDEVVLAGDLTSAFGMFTGWVINQGSIEPTINKEGESVFTMPSEDVEIVGAFKMESAEILFDTCFDDVQNTKIQGEIGSTTTGKAFPANPVKEGYTFKGWYTQKDGKGEKIDKLPEKFTSSTIVYYAYWERQSASYTVIHYLEGTGWLGGFYRGYKSEIKWGNIGDEVEGQYLSFKGYEPLNEENYPHNKFPDYYKDRNGDFQPIEKGIIKPNNNGDGTVLKLYYRALRQEITYHLKSEVTNGLNNGDDIVVTAEAAYGDNYVLIPPASLDEFARPGYELSGWNLSTNLNRVGYDVGQQITVAGDMDLYPVNDPSTDILEIHRNVDLEGGPESETFIEQVVFDATEKGDRYIPNDKRNTLKDTYKFYPNYSFTGLNTKSDGTGENYTFDSNFKELFAKAHEQNGEGSVKVVLYGKWDSREYVVSCEPCLSSPTHSRPDKDWVSSYETQTLKCRYGEKVKLPEDYRTGDEPEQTEGYTFAGWECKDSNGKLSTYAPGYMIEVLDDMVLTAKWERKTYTIKFVIPNPKGDWVKTYQVETGGGSQNMGLILQQCSVVGSSLNNPVVDDSGQLPFYPENKIIDQNETWKIKSGTLIASFSNTPLNAGDTIKFASYRYDIGNNYLATYTGKGGSYTLQKSDVVLELQLDDAYLLRVHTNYPETYGPEKIFVKKQSMAINNNPYSYENWFEEYEPEIKLVNGVPERLKAIENVQQFYLDRGCEHSALYKSYINKENIQDGVLDVYMGLMEDPEYGKTFTEIEYKYNDHTKIQKYESEGESVQLLENSWGKSGFDYRGWTNEENGQTPLFYDKQTVSAEALEELKSDDGKVHLYPCFVEHVPAEYTLTLVNADMSIFSLAKEEYKVETLTNDMIQETITKNGIETYTQKFIEGSSQTQKILPERKYEDLSDEEKKSIDNSFEILKETYPDITKDELLKNDECPFVKQGYKFVKWKAVSPSKVTTPQGETSQLELHETVSLYKDVFLIPVWEPILMSLKIVVPWSGNTVAKEYRRAIDSSPIELGNFGDVGYGYVFTGYNTEPNGNGTQYTADSLVNVKEDITLYVQRKALDATLNFSPNAADGGSGSMPAISGHMHDSITLPDCEFTNPGHEFVEWKLAGGKSYKPGDTYVFELYEGNMYPVWRKYTTITYYANNGTTDCVVQNCSIPRNQSKEIELKGNDYTNFTCIGRRFNGWMENPSPMTYDDYHPKQGGEKVSVSEGYNKIYYASWVYEPIELNFYKTASDQSSWESKVLTIDSVPYTLKTLEKDFYNPNDHSEYREHVAWNTRPDGKGTSYKVGTQVTYGDIPSCKLYPEWEYNKYDMYTITYHANDGTDNTYQESYAGGIEKFSYKTFEQTGLTTSKKADFKGWVFDPTEYNALTDSNAIDNYVITGPTAPITEPSRGVVWDAHYSAVQTFPQENIDLYAVWKSEPKTPFVIMHCKDGEKIEQPIEFCEIGSTFTFSKSKYPEYVKMNTNFDTYNYKLLGFEEVDRETLNLASQYNTLARVSGKKEDMDYKLGDSIVVGEETKYFRPVYQLLGNNIGGSIISINSKDNGATYTFFDGYGNKLTNQTVSGLRKAVYYYMTFDGEISDCIYKLNGPEKFLVIPTKWKENSRYYDSYFMDIDDLEATDILKHTYYEFDIACLQNTWKQANSTYCKGETISKLRAQYEYQVDHKTGNSEANQKASNQLQEFKNLYPEGINEFNQWNIEYRWNEDMRKLFHGKDYLWNWWYAESDKMIYYPANYVDRMYLNDANDWYIPEVNEWKEIMAVDKFDDDSTLNMNPAYYNYVLNTNNWDHYDELWPYASNGKVEWKGHNTHGRLRRFFSCSARTTDTWWDHWKVFTYDPNDYATGEIVELAHDITYEYNGATGITTLKATDADQHVYSRLFYVRRF